MTDLRAVEYGDRLIVDFTIPPLTTEGLTLNYFDNIDLRIEIRPTGFTVVENNKVELPIPCKQAECNKVEMGKDKEGKPVKNLVSYFDYDGLTQKLKDEKVKYPKQKSLIVVPDDRVPYAEVIKTMDTSLGVGLEVGNLTGDAL